MMLGHTGAVKKALLRSAAVIAAFTFFAPAQIASADPTPSPTATSGTSIEQFRIDRDLYIAAKVAWTQQKRDIYIAFDRACKNADRDYKFAMAQAKTPDQKNLAAFNKSKAKNDALAAFDSAMSQLGPEPTPPVEPVRPLKIQKGKNR